MPAYLVLCIREEWVNKAFSNPCIFGRLIKYGFGSGGPVVGRLVLYISRYLRHDFSSPSNADNMTYGSM